MVGLGLIAIYLCLTVDKPEIDKSLLELHDLQVKERLSNYLKDRTHSNFIKQEPTKISENKNPNNTSGKYEHLAINKGNQQNSTPKQAIESELKQ